MSACRDEEDGDEADNQRRGAKRQERVWDDPNDAGLAVPVAERGRLRKLRQSEDEVVLSGARCSRPHSSWMVPLLAAIAYLILVLCCHSDSCCSF